MGSSASSCSDPRRRTASSPTNAASSIVADTVGEHHDLTIDGYSRTKAILPNGKCASSRPFTAGGHEWGIEYYPNGKLLPGDADVIQLFVHLRRAKTKGGEVVAQVEMTLLDEDGNPHRAGVSGTSKIERFAANGVGTGFRMKRDKFEQAGYAKYDRFTVRCVVTVFRGCQAAEQAAPPVVVPPPDMHLHMSGLLSSKDFADVIFELDGGETFTAHRCVLAARSPVFKATLCGSKENAATTVVRIKDIMPEVFAALLSFIYTDSFPEVEEEQLQPMALHLLIAADRYDLRRLKLMCEDKLHRRIDANNVVITLMVAAWHHCHELRRACIEIITSSEKLEAIKATEEFEILVTRCPSIVEEIMSKLAARLGKNVDKCFQ
ncbi:hypothetical protein E2562_024449 [Oryza meyeriana var. granulata]|uniref:BTB domain-containing protein n=1 Tax=Oryza meyeriana var. granulata TaxID=110450 RepID=A0A6G1EYS1_9ORYZ|nr:hypothetical protein E2562_024449 [Oryza meyeriana var. granulata]